MNVLIVDADDDFRDSLSSRLITRGVTVHATGDGDEARDLACRKTTNVVLVGLTSPRESLMTFLREIRQACPGSQVILINHSSDVPLSIEAMKHGASDEIGAPVDLEELMRKLEAVSSGGRRTQSGHV